MLKGYILQNNYLHFMDQLLIYLKSYVMTMMRRVIKQDFSQRAPAR